MWALATLKSQENHKRLEGKRVELSIIANYTQYIVGDNLTALEFACKVVRKERSNGIKIADLKDLVKVIHSLDPDVVDYHLSNM